MVDDIPLYERDPVAWRARLAEGNTCQPRKRVSADVIIRDQASRVLLVDPRYKPDWDLPGGMVESNEPPHEAARRELKEELGLDVIVGELLCVDWVSPHGPWDDLLAFIFDGGHLTADQVSGLRPADDELAAFEFVDKDQARQRLRPSVFKRFIVALEATHTRYLRDGAPAAAFGASWTPLDLAGERFRWILRERLTGGGCVRETCVLRVRLRSPRRAWADSGPAGSG